MIDLKEYDSLASGPSLCVSPFLCSHPRHQRDQPDQSAPLFPLKGQVLSSICPLFFVPTLHTPGEGLHLRPNLRGPFLPSCSCL